MDIFLNCQYNQQLSRWRYQCCRITFYKRNSTEPKVVINVIINLYYPITIPYLSLIIKDALGIPLNSIEICFLNPQPN